MKFIRQEGIRDCGVSCLFNIIRFYGGYVNIEKLRKMTSTNENGTNIYNLVKVANEIGFDSNAYKCELNDLALQTYPLIGYIKLNEFDHFVIITKLDIDKIHIFDPIRGYIIYNIDEFLKVWQNVIITFDKKSSILKEKEYYIDYLYNIVINNKKNIIILSIISFICVCFGFIVSLVLKKVFDNSIFPSTIFLFMFLLIIKSFFEYLKMKISISLNNSLDYSISEKVYTKLYSLPLSYHHNRPVGDISSRITDLYSVEDFISTVISSSIIDIFFVLFITIFTLLISFKIFIIFLLFAFLYFVLYFLFRTETNKRIDDVKEKYNSLNSSFIDHLIGIDSIKNLNLDGKIIEKQKQYKLSYLITYKKFISFISLQHFILDFIESYGVLIIMFIGYKLVKKSSITMGELSMTYSLFLIYFSSIKNLIILDKSFIDSKISFKRIHSLLNIDNKEDGNKFIKEVNSIKFDNISFSYNNSKILNKFNLNIKKGDYVLVDGKSGSGKSTIFKLLNKELELKEGNIFINDDNINEIKLDSIKKNICYVSQNEYLFNDSIKNNILLFKNIKNNELEKVLKVTMLDKVLKNRNISLDYLLEENGHNLSGGERQKILLARTLLRNTDFIIFDETTNEIDIETERKIFERIKTEYKKTIVLISHRNSNVDLFNKRVTV